LTSELPSTSSVDIEDEVEIQPFIEICIETRSDSFHNLNPIPSLQVTNANEPKPLKITDCDTLDQIQRKCEQDCSHETLQDILNDNKYLREKLAESTKNQESLKQQVRVHQSKLKVQNGEQDVDPVKALSDKVVDLGRRLNDRREFLDLFLKLETEKHHKKQLKEKIEFSMYNMSRILESLSTREEFRYPKTDHRKQESTKDLCELLRRVFVDVQESALFADLRSQVSVGDLVQAIVGAAVCEWVFESELRCTAMMDTPLLEALRYLTSTIGKCTTKDHIHTLSWQNLTSTSAGGEAAFQKWYFAAHQLVVSDKHFKNDCVPRAASKLAGRLVGALSPLIKTKKKGRSKIGIKKDLKCIFKHALDVKIQAIVGKYTFGTIWPSRGSAYEESLMKSQSGGIANGAPLKVKLPLVPGLRIYSKEKMAVDYCSFTKSDESDLGKSKAWCKAVVAIEM